MTRPLLRTWFAALAVLGGACSSGNGGSFAGSGGRSSLGGHTGGDGSGGGSGGATGAGGQSRSDGSGGGSGGVTGTGGRSRGDGGTVSGSGGQGQSGGANGGGGANGSGGSGTGGRSDSGGASGSGGAGSAGTGGAGGKATDASTTDDAGTVAACSATEDAYLTPVDMVPYSVSSTLWKARLASLITAWVPHLYDEISNMSLAEGGLANFVQAAKKLSGQSAAGPVGYPFANGYVHNTMEAMSLALMVDPQGDSQLTAAQTKLRSNLQSAISTVLAAQESDGYLQTYVTLGGGKRWTDNTLHEGYVGGYFIESAIAHYLMSKRTDTTMLDSAKKLADCWDTNIGPSPKKLWWDGHEEMEYALTRLARLLNEQSPGSGDKYAKLSKFLLDSRGSGSFTKQEYDQSHAAPVKQTTAVGHAVRAAYLYTAMAHTGILTPSQDYLTAVDAIWTDLVNHKMYVNGGIGSQSSNEGFSDTQYDLPNLSYCEGCSGDAMVFFQEAMNLAHKDARYGDIQELALYNTIMGATDLMGNNFGYTNPLDQNWMRGPWSSVPCCVGNNPRTMLELPRWMYSKSNTSLYVNQYVGTTIDVGTVAGTDVQVVQTTDYPWSGKITLTINPASAVALTLKLRIPNRTISPTYTNSPAVSSGLTSLAVNGQAVTPTLSSGYAVICRTWKAGDTVDLELPMTAFRITTSQVGADKGRTALQYGSMVYNIEDIDYNGANLDNLVLPPTAALTTQWNGSLLDGVTTIKSTFADGTTMTAIPNYARLNRGGKRSIVWIRNQ